MITIYGMDTCPDCTVLFEQIKNNENFEFIDIGKHVAYLKEFLKIRDKDSVFDEAKAKGYIGIPCFVTEEGKVSLSPEAVGLSSK